MMRHLMPIAMEFHGTYASSQKHGFDFHQAGRNRRNHVEETAESGGTPDSPRADDTLIAMDIQHKTENTEHEDEGGESLLAVWKQHITEKYETYSDVLPHLF